MPGPQRRATPEYARSSVGVKRVPAALPFAPSLDFGALAAAHRARRAGQAAGWASVDQSQQDAATVAFMAVSTFAFVAAFAVVAFRPRWIVGHPRSVLWALAGISLLAVLALVRVAPPGLRLAFDPSTEPLLPAGDPGRALYQQAVLEFGDDQVFVIAIRCEEVFTVECLSVIDRITGRVARLSGVRSVSSLLDVTSFFYEAGPDWVVVEPFIDKVPEAPEVLARLRARALADPVYRRTIISDDAKTAAVNVRFREMSDDEFIDSGLDATIQTIVREETGTTARFHVAGRPHIKVHVYEGMVQDLQRLIPLSVAVMAALLWLFTGSIRGVVAPLFTALGTNLWTFGAMAWLGFPLTLLTGLLGPMLLALGSVYGVHVLARTEEHEAQIPDPKAAVLAALSHLRVPVLIAGFTTVVGFAALLITDVPAVLELGAFSIFGVASGTLLVATGVPALLVSWPRSAPHRASRGALLVAIDRGLEAALGALGRGVVRHVRPILWVSGAAVLLAVMAIPRIVIDTDYLSYFDEDAPLRLDFEAVNELLAGAIPLYVVLESDGPGSFREPAATDAMARLRLDFEAVNELLAGAIPLYVVLESDGPGSFREPAATDAMARLQAGFDGVEGVSRTLSFLDSMRVLNRALHADDPAAEKIPETRPGITELLFMIPKNELQRFTTVNHGRSNIVVRTGEVGSAAINELTAALKGVIESTPLPETMRAGVTGNAILLARSADGIAEGQPRSVALAAVTIFLVIALGLRSPRLGAVAMIPNLVPVLLYFGILGLGAAPLSLPTSLIGCVALGIAIDDTVHFLVRYREERSAGATPEAAAQRCTRFVGRPIAVTSVVLVAGFLVVTLSEFATLQEFGVLAAITMTLCLLTDLVLLPALLLRFRI